MSETSEDQSQNFKLGAGQKAFEKGTSYHKQIKERDELIAKNRRALTKIVFELCKKNNIKPEEVKSSTLQAWLKQDPQLFGGLANFHSILDYFMKSMEVLREAVKDFKD